MFAQQSADRTAYATPADIEAGRVTGIGHAISVETGKAIPVYISDAPTPQHPPAPAPVPVQQPTQPTVVVPAPARDPWPARILSSGGTVAGITVAVGHYAPQLGQAAHALQMAGVAVGAATAGIYLLKGTTPKVNVTVNSTINGATATANSTSHARTASGWKNTLQ